VTTEKTPVRSEKESETPVSKNTTSVIKGHFPHIIIAKKVKIERWVW
jgi:hypothetical protein